MLIQKFKAKFNRYFVVGLLGLICLAFVFTGVFPTATNLIMGGTNVAIVGSQKITQREFAQSLQAEMRPYRAFGDKIPANFLNQIRERVLQSLIQGKLLLLEARRVGIQVSEGEIRDTIQKQSYFLDEKTKKFDLMQYRDRLAGADLTPGGYEEMVREDLMRKKILDFLQDRIRITDEELRREYKLAGDKRNLEFVRLRNDDAFPKMKVDQAEVNSYLLEPAKFNLVKGHYDANQRTYKKSDETCARHILIKDQKSKTAPKKLTSFKATAGNFAAMAKKHSEGPTSSKGGDLGCFSKGVMDKEFDRVVTATKVGRVSKPVKSQFGWHIIYVYDRKKGFEKKLDTVKAKIAEELIKKSRFEEIKKINRESAEKIAKNWSAGRRGKFKKQIKETGLFTRVQNSIPSIGRADEIMSAAFDNSAKISNGPQIFEAAGGTIIARIKDKKTADFSKFKAEKDKQEQTLRSRKMRLFLQPWLDQIRTEFPVTINRKLLARMAGA